MRLRFEDELRHRRRMGEVQQALLAARLPRLRRVLHGARSSRSRTRPSRSRTRSAGASRPPARRSSLTEEARGLDPDEARELAEQVSCPVLVIQGGSDAVICCDPRGSARRARARDVRGSWRVGPRAARTRPGQGEPAPARLPRHRPRPARRWVRGKSRRKRALYISSPIGLGHAQRDAAIADELRALHPDLEIDWLAQHPVTAVLEARGERVHPASALPGERVGAHRERVGRARPALLPGDPADGRDPAGELHGLPRPRPRRATTTSGSATRPGSSTTTCTRTRSRSGAAYVWLTDFVGWLPMPDGGDHEALLTADYNAEMIEHIARFPRVRDRAVFVGNPEDIVPDAFGPELPFIRDWTRGALRLRRLRRPGSTRVSWRIATRCGQSSATGPTSRSASSPSAARASAATCCAA